MQLLIRRISADGTVEDLFEGDALVIGRATDSTISLPGLLVALHHARLTGLSASRLKLESLSPMGVEVNGVPGAESAELQAGDTMRIGGHRLRLATGEDKQLVLQIELANPEDALARGAFRSTLADAGMRMRRPALWLALGTLVVGLVIPLVVRYVPMPPMAKMVLPTDAAWLTDGISSAHKHFGSDCAKCHEQLFVPVRDSACLTCHRNLPHHSDDPAIVKVGGIDDRRCASCHREHQGAHGIVPSHPGVCTDCHGAPQRFTDFPDLKPVHDFGVAHPEFRTATNRSGLIFPHDAHLKTAGVRGPDGLEHLTCDGCHVRDRGEASFHNVVFAAQCQRCHQLDVDVGGNPLRLPHGDNDLARAALLNAAKTMPAAPAPVEEDAARRRPGDAAPRGSATLGPAELVDDVIGHRLCSKCHETVRDAAAPVRTRPLMLQQRWMEHAQFTHEPHAWQKCDACHAKQGASSVDVAALPGIESCRTCHGGVHSVDRLQSTCIDCHRFHEASRRVMGVLADGAGAEGQQQ